jgi:HECT-domain (ubiquitin-transferase)
MFVGAELRALLCGPWDIDVDDWQRNTVYGNIDESSPVIKWFWEAVRSFTPKVTSPFAASVCLCTAWFSLSSYLCCVARKKPICCDL